MKVESEKAQLISQLYLSHITHMLLNIVTVQKLGDLWDQIEFEKVKNSKECKELGKMNMKNVKGTKYWRNCSALTPTGSETGQSRSN